MKKIKMSRGTTMTFEKGCNKFSSPNIISVSIKNKTTEFFVFGSLIQVGSFFASLRKRVRHA